MRWHVCNDDLLAFFVPEIVDTKTTGGVARVAAVFDVPLYPVISLFHWIEYVSLPQGSLWIELSTLSSFSLLGCPPLVNLSRQLLASHSRQRATKATSLNCTELGLIPWRAGLASIIRPSRYLSHHSSNSFHDLGRPEFTNEVQHLSTVLHFVCELRPVLLKGDKGLIF